MIHLALLLLHGNFLPELQTSRDFIRFLPSLPRPPSSIVVTNESFRLHWSSNTGNSFLVGGAASCRRTGDIMSDNRPRVCANCGSSPTAGGDELRLCSRCRVVSYCSQECQRSHWKKKHKKVCFLIDSEKLEVNAEEKPDFNTILSYAGTHMSNLKHVDLEIPQRCVLNSDLGFGGGGDEEMALKLKARTFQAFLESTNLTTLIIRFDDCCWDPVRLITKNGKAFLPLANHSNLTKLRITHGCFNDAADLCNSLPPNLKTLELHFLTLSPREGPREGPWPRSAVQALARAVNRLSGLVTLNFQDCYFRDSDLPDLLTGLSQLRCLSLTGAFGERMPGQEGSFLTDQGMAVIARCCPNLHSLDVDYQELATYAGARTILQSCRNLRELHIDRFRITVPELLTLLSSSNNHRLAIIECDPPNFGPAEVKRVVQASGGRTLVISSLRGMVDVPGLSREHAAAQARAKQLVEQASERMRKDDVFDEWDGL